MRALNQRGSLTRSELSKLCEIRKSSVGDIVGELIAAGLVGEKQPGHGRSALHISGERFCVIAASLTSSELKLAAIGLDGRILGCNNVVLVDTEGPDMLLSEITDAVRELANEIKIPAVRLGLALPGHVDPRQGRVHQAIHLKGWKNIPIREILDRNFSGEIAVDNKVRCGLWACQWFENAFSGDDQVLYIELIEGIGGALTSAGKAMVGAHCAAGEIGHMRAGTEGRPCRCGEVDCLETYCSIPALIREIHAQHPGLDQLRGAADIVAAAREVPAIIPILKRCLQPMAHILSNIVALLDPDMIIFGNQNKDFYELIVPILKSQMRSVENDSQNLPRFFISTLETQAALKGAAGKVIDRLFRGEPNRLASLRLQTD